MLQQHTLIQLFIYLHNTRGETFTFSGFFLSREF